MARKGLAEIEKAIEESSKQGGLYRGRLGYLNLKEDESIVVRFVTDMVDVLTVDFYEFIVDNTGKGQNFVVSTDYYENDDETDWVLKLGGKQQAYGTKDLIDPTPKTRSVGLAVVRKEVVTEGANGRPVMTYEDAWQTVDVKGKDGKIKKYEAREFILVKQAHKNFWAPLKTQYKEYGTICDRDYKITRVGGNKDTTYSFIGKKEDPDWDGDASYAKLHKRYGYGTNTNADGVELTKDSEDRFAYCPQTVEEWCEDSCSEDRVKYFLGPLEAREAKNKGGGTDSDTKADTKAPAADEGDEAQAAPPPSSDEGESLSARLKRHQ